MKVDLLPHNQEAYGKICQMYDKGIQRVAVVQPTGSGKSCGQNLCRSTAHGKAD